jgi:serine/threonine protein kinase/WD40 repeat protein
MNDSASTPPSQRQQEMFFSALRIDGLAERKDYLDAACDGDPALRHWVEAEIQKQIGGAPSSGKSLPADAPGAAGHSTISPEMQALFDALKPEEPGDYIGPYRLIEQIGEGGFGIVWRAEQETPVRREVALKVLKIGMDSRQIIARVEQERQALAMMDHPNIARVFDAGATPFGRPFFVMELVRGIPITEYCDQTRLSTRQRLALFVQVCHAVQHAHQKGIIHRDLKPNNVLVSLHDGAPAPKVIDFGLAKAVQKQLTDKTLFTQAEQIIGTPLYMSPEQAEMNWADIDTRTDIYSLGVLLYELLTGRTPVDRMLAENLDYDEIRRVIREEEPPRPSAAFRAMERDALKIIARQHGAEPQKLIQSVQGDLDWITMKALEKERERRYATANDFAADAQRFLASEPIAARPPSALYRSRKFVRRHKVGVSAAFAIALALIIGLAVATWQFVEKNKAYRAAREAQAAEANLRHRAEIEALGARRKAYAADMNLMQETLAANNFGRARTLLNAQRARPGQQDLRGWEWRYLWQQCQSDALFTLCKQSREIFSLAVSHDGKWVAIGEAAGGLSVWDLQARREVARWPNGDGEMLAAFSPTAPLLAFASMEIPASAELERPTATNRTRSIQLWDAATQRPAGELPLSKEFCRGLVFSENGQRLLAATSHELTIWNIAEKRKLVTHAISDMARSRAAVQATRDLSLAAYGVSGGKLRVVDLSTGKECWTAQAANETVMALAFSPNGKVLASGAGYVESAIRLWDVGAGAEIERLEGHRAWVCSLLFWPDGQTLASASGDQTIRLWRVSDLPSAAKEPGRETSPPDAASSRLAATLRGHQLEVWSLALPTDGKTIISGSKDGSVFVWDTNKLRTDQSHHGFTTLPEPVQAWCFARDGKAVLTLDQQGRVIRRQSDDFQQTQVMLEIGADMFDAFFSEDGQFLAATTLGGVIRVWDLEKRTLLSESASPNATAFPMVFLPRSSRLLIADLGDNYFYDWDAATRQEVRSWSAALNLTQQFSVAFSPDRQWLLMVGEQGTSTLLNLANGQETALTLNMKEVSQIGPLGIGGIWETATQRQLGTFDSFLQGMHSVAFSPDGKRMAIGGNGSEAIKLWDMESFEELVTLQAQGSIFQSSAFSPDGSVLGSSNQQGILHLWRAPSLAEINQREAHER